MAENTELIELQVPPADIQPSVTRVETDLLLAPTSIYERLRHFPDNVYDLNPESKLVKFLKVLLGDAGAGQLRKQLIVHRMQATLQGSHFYDLDRFYGPLFGLKRTVGEVLDFNPYVQAATRDQWDEAHAKDASFRSRIEQFSRALAYGATPTGMELIAEALLSVDVDVYESYIQADSSYQTYEELEGQYGTNLLSDNEASIEADATGWAIDAGITALTQSDLWSFPDGFTPGGGIYSLEIEAAGGGDAIAEIANPISVLPGEEYTFATVGVIASYFDSLSGDYGEVLDSWGSPADFLNAHLEIEWYDSGASLIDTSVGDYVFLGDLAAQVFVTDTAPAGADTAVLKIVVNNPVAGDVISFDRNEWSILNYGDLEGQTYGDMEGLGLPRLSGNERRTFSIRPKREITLSESYDLGRVLYKIKPADTRFTIQHRGVPLYIEKLISGAYADSEYWEVIPKVTSASLAINPYQSLSNAEPVEQPRPPFSGYQGEAWSYITDVAGVSASYLIPGNEGAETEQAITMEPVTVAYSDGTHATFPADLAILPTRMVQAGRLVSDAILVTYPYAVERGTTTTTQIIPTEKTSDVLSRIYVDGIPLDDYQSVLETLPDVDPYQQNPQHRYWATPSRLKDDTTEERLEVRLPRNSLVNYISFEVSKYPHIGVVEARDSEGAEWIEFMSWEVLDSSPKVLPPGSEALLREGHPHHVYPNHWQRVQKKLDLPVVTNGGGTRRIRIKMRRTDGTPPYTSTTLNRKEVPYSLAVRGLDVGYRVRSRSDFDFLDTNVIGTTNDPFGSQVQFEVAEQTAELTLDDSLTAWRSEPQPINYAVVNLYLDTRGDGDGTVIDRFYLDPTHDGPHLSIYYSMDAEELEGDETSFMESRIWTPIPRDFKVQKGYLHIPATRARYWKFEFTNLTAEAYENFIPINRQVKLFPRHIVEAMGEGHGQAVEALEPGFNAAIDAARSVTYRDAIAALPQTAQAPESEYLPTEAIYLVDLNSQMKMRDLSWVYGFTPWHSGDHAPRFQNRGIHSYERVEVRHSHKVSFFVGLRTLKAYRANFEANDDPVVYFDTYEDFRNLSPGFTWAFEPGYLTSAGASIPAQATSRTLLSYSPVKALQFATEQSNPVQLVPDSEFRNPALASYDWNDPDDFTRVGDATLIYSPTDYSVMNLRYVVPPLKPIERTGFNRLSHINWIGDWDSGTAYEINDGVFHNGVGYYALTDHTNSEPPSADWAVADPGYATIVQPIHQPVFSYRPWEVVDEAAAAATEGGMLSPLNGISLKGRIYAAVRFTMFSEQSSPLILRILDNDGNVLAEKSIEGRRGQLVEEYLGWDIDSSIPAVRVQLTQEGKSNDQWKLFSLALFDDGIVWEFSVNGGGDWYEAKEIKNNDNGMLTFPAPGNQLRYRVTAYRENMWVSALKIRPHYLGVGNARANGTHRGPNVSYYDQDVPIHEDPMFTSWKKPVPYYWFAVSRRFPLLAVEGAPAVSDFSRFYGRPMSITVDAPDISDISLVFTRVRQWEERLDFQGPTISVARELDLTRDIAVAVDPPTVGASAVMVTGIEGSTIHEIVDPIFSEDMDDSI